jgi:hypothetical protein
MKGARNMVFNGGNNMLFSLGTKPTLTGFMLLVLASCGGGSGQKPTQEGTNLTNPADQAGPAQAQSCEIGETMRDDGSCVRACRVGSDNVEYCLRNNEMPSDIDPIKKVAACKYGIFDRDQCKKVIFKADHDGVALFAGETLRARASSDELTLDRLSLGGYSGAGFQVGYDYVTEYPRAALVENAFGNYAVYFSKHSRSDGYRIVANSFASDPLSKAEIDLYGIKFEMGAMTKSNFSSLCHTLSALNHLPDKDSFKLVELDSYNAVCGETPPSLLLRCEGTDCRITEVAVRL